MKILVADKLAQAGLDWLAAQDDVELDVQAGLPPEELAKVAGGAEGMIVRSGAKVTAGVLAGAGNLRAIARAGVGVDNIDLPEATARGVLVMNTPDANTISTAELALTLMMALSRKVAAASASLESGEWNRKAFQGTQLAGKTLGVIGLGRVGQAVARRAEALEMTVLGFDPYFAGRPGGGTMETVKDLSELCSRADYITVHVPKSAETDGMIGAEQLAKMKPTVRLINAARGGIIDEAALADALEAGKVAGAALDVFTAEPPASDVHRRLIEHPSVLAVPHLGASTEEAQEQVALDAAKELVEVLRGGAVRNAVNAPGFGESLPEFFRPFNELANRLGRILTAITPGGLKKIAVVYRGDVGLINVTPITTNLLVGLLAAHLDRSVNVINAPLLAEQRHIEVTQTTSATAHEFTNVMEVTVQTDRTTRRGSGTIIEGRHPRITSLDGYRMELKPEGHIAILFNRDFPGVIGRYGTTFGNAGVNIADMTVARMREGMAVVGLNLDAAPSPDVMAEIRAIDFVTEAHAITLPSLPANETEMP
ncbi:MAG: phosphoglycerate dehydrogenase [Planctomycetota bacterium]|jgi:D-3-phosphoglycerate dehydrogenase